MAIFNRTYSPLRTQLSMLVAEGSLTQDYNADNKVYTPDRRIRPTAIQPVCRITDPAGILDNGVINRYITDVKWYENEISEANLISPNDTKYKIDSTSNTDSRGRIIVMKNVHFDTPVTLIFTATFADMVNGKLRRKVYFVGRSVLASNVAASSPLVLKADYPRGRCFNPIKGLDHLKLTADLVSGDKPVPAAYWWYRKNGINETLITDFVGHNTRELEVPTASIGKEQHYVCKTQDCRQDLTQLRDNHTRAGLDKIADCPRNLLAKQYLLDLNEELRAGVVVEGEDADGKYLCIPHPESVYALNGSKEHRDLFSGKIKFKENTAYSLRISCKYVDPNGEDKIGGYLLFVYTDGTTKGCSIYAYNTLKEGRVTSDPTKTLSRISWTYGHVTPLYIYDIQLTEEYNHNLLQGNTEEIRAGNQDTGTDADKFKLASVLIPGGLSAGRVLSLKIGEIIDITGSPAVYSVGIFQKNESGAVTASNIVDITKVSPVAHVTVNSACNPDSPVWLYLYAGKAGATTGNSTVFKNVQLVSGRLAWNMLGEDIPEVTVIAGTDTNKYSRHEIKGVLSAGGKYVVEVGDVINLEGSATEHVARLYQFDGPKATISSSGMLSKDKKKYTFTVGDKYDPAFPAYLLLYAGTNGATAGNSVRFENVRLLQGDSAYPSMPPYSPHFIPAAPDIEAESERIELPAGYRPDEQGKTIDHEFTLVTRLPPYKFSVVTPYGDDSGVISIPSDVKLFPAWIKADVSGIGTLDHPERYFSADWGNGLKGMNVILDADDIGLGVQEVAPDVVEGTEHVRYAVKGIITPATNFANLENIESGTRLVADVINTTLSSNIRLVKKQKGIYCYINSPGKSIGVVIRTGVKQKTQVIAIPDTKLYRLEVVYNDDFSLVEFYLNGKIVQNNLINEMDSQVGDNLIVSMPVGALSIYSPSGTLQHKYDFQGATITERLSDKADTASKVDFVRNDTFELIPV